MHLWRVCARMYFEDSDYCVRREDLSFMLVFPLTEGNRMGRGPERAIPVLLSLEDWRRERVRGLLTPT